MKFIEEITETPDSDVIEIKSADYISDYIIKIIFNDNHESMVDFKPFLENSQHPQIKGYLKLENFKRYSIVDGNLNWNDYGLIFPIADLYKGKIK